MAKAQPCDQLAIKPDALAFNVRIAIGTEANRKFTDAIKQIEA